MKLIKIAPSKYGQFYAQVDDEDFEWLNQWIWHLKKSSISFYAVRNDYSNNGHKHIIICTGLFSD